MGQLELSQTAIVAAMWRAIHTLKGEEPKLLVDPFARGLAGYPDDESLLQAYAAHPASRVPWTAASVLIRNRLAEDEVSKAVSSGLKQYVLLGAGMDSFAYRRQDLMSNLNVYEVDHPATQAWKRRRMAELGMSAPGSHHFIPVDFEQDSLTNALITAGIDRAAPVLFSWLGVAFYLSRDAVNRTLREVAALSTRESIIVLQFIAPASDVSEEDALLVTAAAAQAEKLGEPWRSYFTSADMEEQLRRSGFASVEHFGPREASVRYLENRTDGLRLPGYFRMAKATTAPTLASQKSCRLCENWVGPDSGAA